MPSRARLLFSLVVAALFAAAALPVDAQRPSRKTFVPLAIRNASTSGGCQATGESYSLIPVEATPPIDRPIEQHPDFNLAARGWVTVNQPRVLVHYNHPNGVDPNAPHLFGLFGDSRTPAFTSTHQVNDWAGGNILPPRNTWPVTLLGMATTPGETLRLPDRGPDIYQGVYKAMVLYASEVRITWTYTRFGYISSPQGGYGVHVENVCVDPNLVALYRAADRAGRGQLPALRGGQQFGRASGGEILVAIRDSGDFLDPRSQEDWWPGRAAVEVGSGGLPRPDAVAATPTPAPSP